MQQSQTYIKSLPGRYAKALFDLVSEETKGSVADFEGISLFLEEWPYAERLLNSNILKRKDVLIFWQTVGEKLNFSKFFIYFLSLLSVSKRLNILPEIRIYFNRLCNGQENRVNATITSAKPLSAAVMDDLNKTLCCLFHKEINAVFHENQNLLAGFTIQVDQFMIDASYKNFLHQLSTTLRG